MAATVGADQQQLVIRPARRVQRPGQRRAATAAAIGFGLAAVVRLGTMSPRGQGAVVVATVLGCCALFAAGWVASLVYADRASLTLEEGWVAKTDLFNHVFRVRRAAVVRALLVEVRMNRMTSIDSPQLIFLDSDGRCVMRLFASGYTNDQLRSFCTTMGVPLEVTHGRAVLQRALYREIPGAYQWWHAQNVLLTWIGTLVLIGVVVALGGGR